jgi:hypothetical protein
MIVSRSIAETVVSPVDRLAPGDVEVAEHAVLEVAAGQRVLGGAGDQLVPSHRVGGAEEGIEARPGVSPQSAEDESFMVRLVCAAAPTELTPVSDYWFDRLGRSPLHLADAMVAAAESPQARRRAR